MGPSRNGHVHGGSELPTVANDINFKGKAYSIVREGLADILNPRPVNTPENGSIKQSVFYNPIQQFNRDLSVLAIRVFAEDLATIRRARRERALLRPARDGKKGSKRKRTAEPGAEEQEESTVKKRAEEQSASHPVRHSLVPATSESARQARNEEALLFHGSGAASVDLSPAVEAGAGDKPELNRYNGQAGAMSNGSNPRSKDTTCSSGGHRDGCPTGITSHIRILDALSATGLRALRYVKEIPHVALVTANDLSSSATASIKLNAEYNGIADQIQPTTGDAKALMYHTIAHNKDLFHVIDLDPYGTAVPFLDAAVQAVQDGGLLCVTCTDAGVFASVGFPEKTFSQYGGVSWKGTQGHEAGLRLILNAVATSAARYGLAIEPLLSLNIDFYARLFVRVARSPAGVKFLASKTMVVYNCDHGCGSFSTQYMAQSREREAKNGDKFYTHSLAQGPSATPYCEHCGFKTHLAGPMWGGPLHNPHFVTKILDTLPPLDDKVYGTIPRIEAMLTLALNETLIQESEKLVPPKSNDVEPIVPLDPALRDPHPFFINPSVLARTLHCVVPSDAALRGALVGLGYRTTRSHTEPGSIRTDAPWTVIWEIMREWVRQKNPIKEGALTKGMAGWEIMRKDRSRRGLVNAKQALREILDTADDAKSLQASVEAVLCGLNGRVTAGEGGKEVDGVSREEGAAAEQKELEVVFDEKLGKQAAGKKMLRYQMNPRPDWGPMSKAKAEH
ncbi:MAG: hypothetical protein L6R40_004736 [Gallowayella cf. fulva]|nr:MAG: hypothetical protein L6R40_004736 [Xanthomendoza cf. fulva]